jgi:KDO2-lipid IV(A) lauroyltransferase
MKNFHPLLSKGVRKINTAILAYLLRYRKKIILKNLRLSFPEWPESKVLKTLNDFYKQLSRLIEETPKTFHITEKKLEQFIDWEIDPKLFLDFEQGKDVILVGGHFGNWEWVVHTAFKVPFDCIAVYKPVKNKKIDNYLIEARSASGMRLIPMRQMLAETERTAEKPRLFMLIADQSPVRIEKAHWINFLQRDTAFFPGPAKIAANNHSPVYYFRFIPVDHTRYIGSIDQIVGNPDLLTQREITLAYARRLEEDIIEYPHLWLWSHKRWKRKRPASIDIEKEK